MSTLYLFTEYYPTGSTAQSEHAFVSNELKYLKGRFERVVIVPSLIIDDSVAVTDAVEVDFSLYYDLSRTSHFRIVLFALSNTLLYKELFDKEIFFWSYRNLKKLLYSLGRAVITQKWVSSKIDEGILDPYKSLFYTYWFTEITLGLSLDKRNNLVSRSHGYDLYEEYHGYIPLFKDKFNRIQALIVPSKRAFLYLKKRFPQSEKKIKLFYLGVCEAQKYSIESKENLIRIVSCSHLRKLKRVHLIPLAIKILIDKYNCMVDWTHFGDGLERDKVLAECESIAGDSFKFGLLGNTKNEEILSYYSNNAIDIFIHLSESEGGVPMAIQEAQAHGIPVIAADVGGIPDILKHEEVGFLLSSDPTPDEIADAILYVVSDKAKMVQMRKKSILNWETNFNEKVNYQKFSNYLASLIKNDGTE